MLDDMIEEMSDINELDDYSRDQPRSVVSLDHNGPSSRIVIFGGRNVVTVDRSGLSAQRPEGVSVTYLLGASVLPSVWMLTAMFVAGLTVGYFVCAFFSDIVRV